MAAGDWRLIAQDRPNLNCFYSPITKLSSVLRPLLVRENCRAEAAACGPFLKIEMSVFHKDTGFQVLYTAFGSGKKGKHIAASIQPIFPGMRNIRAHHDVTSLVMIPSKDDTP